MPRVDFNIRQNDTGPTLDRTLTDSEGATVDITGATIVFNMRDTNGTVKVNRAVATIVGAGTAGTVRYSWVAADTNTTGLYNGEFEVTFASGRIQTFPNPGAIRIQITDDIA